jgi:HD superfamily phosphohydrolase
MAKKVHVPEQQPLTGEEEVVEIVSEHLTNEADIQRYSTKEDRQELFIPVSGFVWLYPEEMKVIDHPTFQRLGRIYQLGQAYVVYRGATHKRLEHALGTLNVVQRMIDAVNHNGKKNKLAKRTSCLTREEERFIRLGALLHDIGHIVAGHTVEDELCLLGKHDGDQRLDHIFESDQWKNRDGMTLASLIEEQYTKYVPASLKGKIIPSRIVRLLVRKEPPLESDSHHKENMLLKESNDIRAEVCRFMIGNTICADLLDYLHRDWYHIGKARPFDDRILQYMEIRTGTPDKFVISLGRRPKIRTDAISAILELLEWRYSLAESVLFHRTKLAAAAMLDRALFELWGDDHSEDIESFLLPLSDEEMLSRCREKAALDTKNKAKSSIATELLSALERRELWSHLSTRFYGDLQPDVVAAIERTYGGADNTNPKEAARNRNKVLRVLESDFGLPPGSLTMYCPGGVNAKIAMVQIAFGDDIEHFSKYEEKHNKQLSGGHLDAQLQRFRRLWRVHFFIKKEVKEKMGESLKVLQEAIDKLALGNLKDEDDASNVSRSLALALVRMEGSHLFGQKVGESVSAAYKKANTATGSYPLGANSIKSYLEQISA